MYKLRLFSNNNCMKCLKLLNSFKKLNISNFEYIDAFLDENQEFCDLNNVDEIPHLQIVNSKGHVEKNIIGICSEKQLENIKKYYKIK